MATRGFLIRFIDIGLIVLFGFLMISDIEAASRVELAGSGDVAEEEAEPEEAPVLVTVEIAADGAFLVEIPSGALPQEDVAGVETDDAPEVGDTSEGAPAEASDSSRADGTSAAGDAVRMRIPDVAALEDALRTAARANDARGRATVVVIEPSPASAVQRTVDVMDVSDRLGLQKSLRMDIQVVAPDSTAGGSGAP